MAIILGIGNQRAYPHIKKELIIDYFKLQKSDQERPSWSSTSRILATGKLIFRYLTAIILVTYIQRVYPHVKKELKINSKN